MNQAQLDLRTRREQAIFRLLLDDPAIADLADIEPRHFLDILARPLWEHAQALRGKGVEPTGFALLAAVKDEGQRAASQQWLRAARLSVAHAGDLDALVSEIRGEADLDEIGRIADEAARAVLAREIDPITLAGKIQEQLSRAVSRVQHSAETLAAKGERAAWEIIRGAEKVAKGETDAPRISTGLLTVDREIGGGLPRGSWTVVAARPGIGKTSFVMQVARSSGARTLVFLYEDVDDIIHRELAAQTGIGANNIAGCRVDRKQASTLLAAARRLSDRVWVVNARGMDAMTIARITRALVRQHGIELLCVDYLNRMRHVRTDRDRYDLAIRGTLDVLDDLLGELRIAGVLGCQLGRAVTKENRAPRIDDARDAGAIEEICKLGICLHRPFVDRDASEGGDSEMWLILDKQNLGKRRQVVVCDWDGPAMTIRDRQHAHEQQEMGPYR